MRKGLLIIACVIGFGSTAQNALNFDGGNDFVQTTYSAPSGNANRTVEAWVQTLQASDPSQGGIEMTILEWGGATPGSRFALKLSNNNSIRIDVGGDGISGLTPVNDGLWHHLAVSYDSSAIDNFTLYIDGAQEASGNMTSTFSTSVGNLVLGRNNQGGESFRGSIDEVRIWDVSRTGTEIAENMDSISCYVPAELKAYYDFNEGTAGGTNTQLDTLPELANGNYGVLNNFGLSGSSSNWVSGVLMSGGSSTDSSLAVSECYEYTSPSGKYTWNISGNFLDTIPNAVGCDSVLYIALSIVSININVQKSGTTLTSTNPMATAYQWVDCLNGYTEIAGETGQSFTATENGEYAVVIYQDGCSDTSDCKTISGIGVGIEESKSSDLQFYPNPAQESLNIVLPENIDSWELEIIDLLAKSHYLEQGSKTQIIHLDISDLKAGIYFIVLSDSQMYKQYRFIVQ